MSKTLDAGEKNSTDYFFIPSSVFFIIFIISRHALLETVIRPQPKGLLTERWTHNDIYRYPRVTMHWMRHMSSSIVSSHYSLLDLEQSFLLVGRYGFIYYFYCVTFVFWHDKVGKNHVRSWQSWHGVSLRSAARGGRFKASAIFSLLL